MKIDCKPYPQAFDCVSEEGKEWGRVGTILTFADEPEEVHALVLGVYCGWKGYELDEFIKTLPAYLQLEIRHEYHYFIGGKMAARFAMWFLPILKRFYK